MHVMLDLETWGTRPGSALRSIGAVTFHLDAKGPGQEFYRNIEKDSCLRVGLTIDSKTVAWWGRQSPESVAALENTPQRPLATVVGDFHDFFRTVGGKYIWCHGANFDEPLWAAACRALMRPVPWQYWDTRCTRTLFAMADFDMRSIPREGVAHDALADAMHQARCVQLAIAKLRAPSPQQEKLAL